MTPDIAAERADACWSALRPCLRRDGERVAVVDPGRGPTAAWPTSQVLVAALLHGALSGRTDAALGLVRGLERFATTGGYADAPRGWRAMRRTVYYDDNAWLGLAGVLARHLGLGVGDLPEQALRVVASGEDPRGGIRWRVGDASRNACSTGPGGALAAWLASGDTRVPGIDGAAALALRCSRFLHLRLVDARGLVADHVRPDGSVEPTVWSYNQGSLVHLDLLLGRQGIDADGADRARALAGRAVAFYAADPARLWREPPAFVAVLARSLAALGPGDPGWAAVLDPYLDRAWREARRADGLMTGGGIGRYDAGTALDQAAFVQMFALRARPDLAAVVT